MTCCFKTLLLETIRRLIQLKNLVDQLTLLDDNFTTIARDTYLSLNSSFWHTRISLQLDKKSFY